MKLLTLNTHSLVEENYGQKIIDFVEAVSKELPQIVALQEVNQTCSEEIVPKEELAGFVPCNSETDIRRDNHIYNVVKLLRERGINYYWTWLPMKKGYGKYDEGIALMSLSPIIDTKVIRISNIDDYNNWKTRKILGICTEESPDEWFYSVHFGWWDDEDDPFEAQWNITKKHMSEHNTAWIMGDFNSPAEVRNEGYDLIKKAGWHDSYAVADKKDKGFTVEQVIDGWREKISDTSGMRIDQIWCSRDINVTYSKVIFNGRNYPVVSDHYGIIIDYERN